MSNDGKKPVWISTEAHDFLKEYCDRTGRTQVDVVSEAAAAQLPQLLEEEGSGDDRRASVEGEAVLAIHVGTPSRLVAALQHGHAVSPRA